MATEGPASEMLLKLGAEAQQMGSASAGAETAPEAGSGLMDDRTLGRHMAEILKTGSYHPVIIVGANASGKSSFVASLLARTYASDHGNGVDFRLAQDCIFPEQHPRYAAIETQTRLFYDGTVGSFADWQLVARTGYEHPFYVPVELVPRDARFPPIRLAFLECRGEFFNPAIEKVRDLNSEREYLTRSRFPDEISSVLANFNLPISFVYVAPCSVRDDAHGINRRKADLAVYYGMERIQGIRGRSGLDMSDQHLLLLSKWDEHVGGVSSPEFVHTLVSDVEDVLRVRFPESWKKYCSMRPAALGSPYHVMQYTAGPVAEGQFARAAPESHMLLDRYPRTVLNWLYGNAVPGKVLFPDVLEQPPPRRTVVDKIVNLIVEGSFR